jgi:prephenate dehydratase
MNCDPEIRDLDVVAMVADIPVENLVRGQVGPVVDLLDGISALVEFSNEKGNGYAFVPIHNSLLLPLIYKNPS